MINFNKISNNNTRPILTEQINITSNELDIKTTNEIVRIFTEADKEPQKAVENAIPEIINAIDKITEKLKLNGRLFILIFILISTF